MCSFHSIVFHCFFYFASSDLANECIDLISTTSYSFVRLLMCMLFGQQHIMISLVLTLYENASIHESNMEEKDYYDERWEEQNVWLRRHHLFPDSAVCIACPGSFVVKKGDSVFEIFIVKPLLYLKCV